ncbi:MAG: hypothetical protein OSB43_02450 [Nocardioides sp.]|uniref:hypothetical protein n=1 Tax=Nocardioides sp. TaxID=35761 RepID=UPI0023A1466F|nr:hypothetical protein [Nocardioides sp.]MDE0775123.1 hypothetical protein [Nocardioides sp.]
MRTRRERASRRHAVVAVAAVAALVMGPLLGGCQGEARDASQAGEDLPDCSASECAEEVAALADEVGSLPGVAALEVSYRAEQVTNGASVIGSLEVEDGTACGDLEDDLGRLLWQSRISPVTSVNLRCYLPGASGPDYETAKYAFVLQDGADLTRAWGPRGG